MSISVHQCVQFIFVFFTAADATAAAAHGMSAVAADEKQNHFDEVCVSVYSSPSCVRAKQEKQNCFSCAMHWLRIFDTVRSICMYSARNVTDIHELSNFH